MGYDGFYMYNVDRDNWTDLTLPTKPSHDCSMVLHSGLLIVSGGYERYLMAPNDRVQVYDIEQNTWSMATYTMPLVLARHWTVVVNMPTSE